MLEGPLRQHYPVFAGWGFHLQFLFLTDGRVPYSFIGSPQIARINKLLAQHDGLAVVVPTADRKTITDAFVTERELTFAQRDGVKVFSVLLLSSKQNQRPDPGNAQEAGRQVRSTHNQ